VASFVPGAAATGGWYAHDGRRTAAPERHLLLHGLDHVDDPDQVMFPTVSAASPSAAPPAT